MNSAPYCRSVVYIQWLILNVLRKAVGSGCTFFLYMLGICNNNNKFNSYSGYSKLITELLSVDDTLPASTIAQRMLSLIGTFSLDPNRYGSIDYEYGRMKEDIACVDSLHDMNVLEWSQKVFNIHMGMIAVTIFLSICMFNCLALSLMRSLLTIAMRLQWGRSGSSEAHSQLYVMRYVRCSKSIEFRALTIIVDICSRN